MKSQISPDRNYSHDELSDKLPYEKPQIHKIEKVTLVTHGSKDLEDDSDTGGYQKTKPASSY